MQIGFGCVAQHWIHGYASKRKGKIPKVIEEYQQVVIPVLKRYFDEDVLPNADPRPTVFVRDVVTNKISIARDGTNVQELDPGMTKNRLFFNYAFKNGWRVSYNQTTRNYTIQKRNDRG